MYEHGHPNGGIRFFGTVLHLFAGGFYALRMYPNVLLSNKITHMIVVPEHWSRFYTLECDEK